MFFYIVFIIIGFTLLIKGADFLVNGSSELAKKLHIPEIVVGLTIVSIGTSMPEMIVSVMSAKEGFSDISIGNVIGSNFANLFLILGLCSIIKPLKIKKQTKLIDNPINFISTFLLFIMGNMGNEEYVITKKEGMCLLILSFLFIIYNIIIAKNTEKKEKSYRTDYTEINIFKCIFNIALGIILLKFAGDLVINNSITIANRIGVSEKLISLTIIAVSTSLPELITSVIATKKGETDMAIGNVLGSQIFNILLIIGTAACITPINYNISYNKDIIMLLAGTIALELFSIIGRKNVMTRLNGIQFLIVYVIYMINIIR